MAKRKSVNTKLQDLAILRAAYLEKLKNGDVRKTMQFINDELLPEVVGKLSERLARADAAGVDRGPLTTERLSEVGSVLEGVLGNGIGKKTKDLIEKSLIKTGESEARWQVKTLTEMTKPLGLSYSMPSTAIIRQVVKERAPFGNTISEHLEGISTRAAGEIKKELRLGISQGESTDQIISRVRGTIDANYEDGVFEKVRKNVAAVVRTSTNYVVNQAREETIKANEDIIGSVKLVATLDDRTSLICAARDGEVYPINEGPRPPFHPNCRTMVVPITKSAEELGLEGILQDGDEDILARESMDGEVPADYTYEEWLAEQDEETQKKVLGLERWQMWTDGQISLRDLINDKSQVLTIDDLDELTGNREDAVDASQEETQA
jgi:SPP1 gp7 family putative phage head morphogenesis protein